MGLFGFGRKKKEEVPSVEHFLYQRLDAADPDDIYAYVRRQYDKVVKNTFWSPGDKYGSPIKVDLGLRDIRFVAGNIGINEEGMDPIPKKTAELLLHI